MGPENEGEMPGLNFIKLFVAVTDEFLKQAEAFVHNKLFPA
jgi:hypothetical protein